jgi:hypothetical protein
MTDARGTLSFEGVGADISAGRFRELLEGDGRVPAVEDMSSVRDGSGLWCVVSRSEGHDDFQMKLGEAWNKRLYLRKERPRCTVRPRRQH